MKKILTLAAVALATAVSVNAGDVYIGGSLGFAHDSNKYSEFAGGSGATNTLDIMPEFGVNLSEKWAIGTVIGYEMEHYCNTKINTNVLKFDPYVRFSYFRSSDNFVQLFVDGGAGIGWGRMSGKGWKGSSAVLWNVGLRPGIALNFSEKFSLVAHIGFLGYEGANHTAEAMGYSRKGGVSFDTNDLTIGFYYTF